jgi:hypothetical protein
LLDRFKRQLLEKKAEAQQPNPAVTVATPPTAPDPLTSGSAPAPLPPVTN